MSQMPSLEEEAQSEDLEARKANLRALRTTLQLAELDETYKKYDGKVMLIYDERLQGWFSNKTQAHEEARKKLGERANQAVVWLYIQEECL